MCFPAESGDPRWLNFISAFSDIVVSKTQAVQGDPQVIQPAIPTLTVELTSGNWDKALIVEISDTSTSWNQIGRDISHKFNFKNNFDLFPFEENKAFFFVTADIKDHQVRWGFWIYNCTSIRILPWWDTVNSVYQSEFSQDNS